MHGLNREHSRGKGTHSRGATLTEVIVSLSIILLMVTTITIAVGRAQIGQAGALMEDRASVLLSEAVKEAATQPFATLVAGTWTPPDLCTGQQGGIGAAAQSCLKVSGQEMKVNYSTSVQTGDEDVPVSVTLTGTLTLANGNALTSTRVVNARNPLGAVGSVTVNVVDGTGFTGSIGLIDDSGGAVSVSDITDGEAVLLDPLNVCTTLNLCHVGVVGGDMRTDGQPKWMVSAVDSTGNAARIATTPGLRQSMTAHLVQTGAFTFNLAGENATQSGVPTQPGSVCLWAQYSDSVGMHLVPLCNSHDSGELTFNSYTSGKQTVQLAAGSTVKLLADRPDLTCPLMPGMMSHAESGWVSAAVCASWTWGIPTSLNTGFGPILFDSPEATLTIPEGSVDLVTLTYSGDGGRPAGGYDGDPTWSKPRDTTDCASTDGCLTPGVAGVEATECPGEYCHSSSLFPPVLVAPTTGSAKVHTVHAGTGSTDFNLRVSDPDSPTPVPGTGPVIVRLLTAPTLGRLLSPTGVEYAAGDVIGNGLWALTPADVPVTYARDSSGVDTFTIEITNSTSQSVRETVGLYTANAPWLLSSDDVTVAQGGSVPALVAVTGVDGEPLAGANVTATGVGAPTGGTSNGSGVASVVLTPGTTLPGRHTETFRAGVASTTAVVTVTGSVSAVSLESPPGDIPQGGSTIATGLAVDGAGVPVAGALVRVSVTGPSDKVTTNYAVVQTNTDGRVSIPLHAASNAVADSGYLLTLTSNSVTTNAGFSVTLSADHVSIIDTANLSVNQGASTTLTVLVTDVSGVPMSGATVAASTSDTQGLIIVTGGPTDVSGQTTVTVTASSHASAGARPLLISAGAAQATYTLIVKPVVDSISVPSDVTVVNGTGSVVVQVLDKAGDGISGVIVELNRFSGSGFSSSSRLTSRSDGSLPVHVTAQPGAVSGQLQLSATGVDPAFLTVTIGGTP